MSYMPVYCLIDINTGEARGFKLEGLNSFSTKEERWHFVDVCADDRYVYALYSGEILFNPDGTYIPDTLYVFGWNGDVKLKCKLNHRFSELNIDNGYLYLRNSDGDMASIKTEQFLQLLQ